MKHEASKSEVVKSGEGLGKAFIVSCQAPEACGPGKAALNHPSARQEDEAVFRFGAFNTSSWMPWVCAACFAAWPV